MALNQPRALLPFPNEVLDDILGHLVTSLPPNSKRHTGKSYQLQALEKVSLVSKQWRAVALRRLVAKLVVRIGTQARAITEFLTSGDSELVKELIIEGGSFKSKGVPTAAEMGKHDSVTSEDVVALLRHTNHLKILRLHHVDFVHLRRRKFNTLETLSFRSSVETLAIKSPAHDVNLELMTTLIPLFPALHSIVLSLPSEPKTSPFKSPPSTHALLTSLDLDLYRDGASFATLLPFISTAVPNQIKSLKITGWNAPDLDPLMKHVGPGLERLENFFRTGLDTGLQFCPHLKLLIVKSAWTLWGAVRLLQQIPSSVITLRIAYKHLRLLAALETTPKPSGLLRLELDHSLEENSGEMVQSFKTHGLEVIFADVRSQVPAGFEESDED
ncbi:hypothetical protein RQP46_008561 [Phenoliferia psychrophenolica]